MFHILTSKVLPPIVFLITESTWIIGSSLVFWAADRAGKSGVAFPIAAQTTTKWLGERGMKWCQLLPRLRALLHRSSPPERLIIHLGGNDLTSFTLQQLEKRIKGDLTEVKVLMPHTVVIWSDITARKSYRHARSNAKVEKARKSLNSTVHTHVSRMGGISIRHPSIIWHSTELYRGDGVHLSNLGNDTLLQDWFHGMSDATSSYTCKY